MKEKNKTEDCVRVLKFLSVGQNYLTERETRKENLSVCLEIKGNGLVNYEPAFSYPETN